jgi:hypothetical protein
MASRAAGDGPYGFSFELRSMTVADAGRGGAADAACGRTAVAPRAAPRERVKRRRDGEGGVMGAF